MKRIALLAAALILGGCASTPPACPQCQQAYQTPPCAHCAPTGWRPKSSMYSVVNNTGATLSVYQEGKYLGELETGMVMPVKATLLWNRTTVTVVGHCGGTHMGTDSYIFEYAVPEVWTVTRLLGPARPLYH